MLYLTTANLLKGGSCKQLWQVRQTAASKFAVQVECRRCWRSAHEPILPGLLSLRTQIRRCNAGCAQRPWTGAIPSHDHRSVHQPASMQPFFYYLPVQVPLVLQACRCCPACGCCGVSQLLCPQGEYAWQLSFLMHSAVATCLCSPSCSATD